MKAHRYAEIFPMLDDGALAELAKDIAQNGLKEPVLTYRGEVLDGRNRLRACEIASVKPRFEMAKADNDEEALSLVMSLNLHRRHLNESQRAIVGARVLPFYETLAAERKAASQPKPGQNVLQRNAETRAVPAKTEQAKPNQVGANLPPPAEPVQRTPHKARDDAAAAVNVSSRSVENAKKVIETAAPEVVAAVESGRMAVSAAAKITKETPEVQRRVVEAVSTGAASSAEQAIRQVRDEDRTARGKAALADVVAKAESLVTLTQGDAVEEVSRLTVQPHLVVTDPPYGISVHRTRSGGMDYEDGEDAAIPLFRELCAAMVEKLHPSAHIYVFAGYSHVHTFKAIMAEFFDVQDNPLIWVKDNHTMCDFSRKYPNRHEYILFGWMRGSDRRLTRCVSDVLTIGREKTTTHSAQKPTELLKILIEQSSEVGELVLDPFAGSGSTGVAAAKAGRRCILIEKDEKWHGIAQGRLHDEQL